jgi:alpha-L-fucosidase
MTHYLPTYESLDTRPLPSWFAQEKIGIFLHWGPYSGPGYEADVSLSNQYGQHGFECWYEHSLLHADERPLVKAFHERMFQPGTTYTEIAPHFRAELYAPAQWAELFARSGARYVFLTSKFHDGFALWGSKYSPRWNSLEVGAHRDLLGDFCAAIRGAGLRAGFYYSLLEHGHPWYNDPELLPRFVSEHIHPQLQEVVSRYAPSLIYFDGEWDHPETVWRMREFLTWLYNESPCKNEVVVNDRWGSDSRGRHGDVYCSEIGSMKDRENEHGFTHPWMEDRPLSRNWARNRNQRLDHYMSERDMLHSLVETLEATSTSMSPPMRTALSR